VNRISWSQGLSGTADGVVVVPLAGAVAVRLLADRVGLTSGLSAALARRGFIPGPSPPPRLRQDLEARIGVDAARTTHNGDIEIGDHRRHRLDNGLQDPARRVPLSRAQGRSLGPMDPSSAANGVPLRVPVGQKRPSRYPSSRCDRSCPGSQALRLTESNKCTSCYGPAFALAPTA
jgi:hypothetical protein